MHTIKYPYKSFIRVSRFQGVTKYSAEYQGFKVWPNIHSSIKVPRYDQIFIRVSRFQCGTKYSFRLECRIEGIIECRIKGRIEGRIIYTVQASKYGCHISLKGPASSKVPDWWGGPVVILPVWLFSGGRFFREDLSWCAKVMVMWIETKWLES